MSSYWSQRRKIIKNVNRFLSDNVNNNHQNDVVSTKACFSRSVDQLLITSNFTIHNSNIDNHNDNASVNYQPQSLDTLNIEVDETFYVPEMDEEQTNFDCSDSQTSDDESNLEQDLKSWALKFNVSSAALGSLLSILKPFHPYLPKDCRTLMKYDATLTSNIIDCDVGHYYHFGIESAIEKYANISADQYTIELQVNVDVQKFKLSILSDFRISS